MGDSVYVAEYLVRMRLEELRAEAARAHLLAGLPPRPSLARRALAAALGLMRVGGQRSAALTTAEHPR